MFDTIGGDALTRSPLALADAGRSSSGELTSMTTRPSSLLEAWQVSSPEKGGRKIKKKRST